MYLIQSFNITMQNSIMTGIDFNRGTTNLMKVNFAFQDPNVSVLRQLMAVDGSIKMVCEHNNLYSRCNQKKSKVHFVQQTFISCVQFAIVHPVGANTMCPIKALILVWNDKLKQFTGLIPLEQVTL